jgi:hypothetical protein
MADLFAALAAKGDEIAFRYLFEGCECRAQFMIEYLEAMGINPGRAWAVAVGRDLAFPHPTQPRATIKWRNHTAPTVALEGTECSVLVIDPATQTGPVTLRQWAASMRATSIEVSQVPLSQAEILAQQTARALRGEDFDAVLFSLARGQAPIPEVGGSGFRLAPDPPEGVSAFAHAEMRRLLGLQQQMFPAAPNG